MKTKLEIANKIIAEMLDVIVNTDNYDRVHLDSDAKKYIKDNNFFTLEKNEEIYGSGK